MLRPTVDLREHTSLVRLVSSLALAVAVAPHLGYGEEEIGGVIPPDSILLYEVELLGGAEVASILWGEQHPARAGKGIVAAVDAESLFEG